MVVAPGRLKYEIFHTENMKYSTLKHETLLPTLLPIQILDGGSLKTKLGGAYVWKMIMDAAGTVIHTP